LKSDFEKTLMERGYIYQCDTDGYYIIFKKNRIQPPIKVQLLCSRPINTIIHGSQNGNDLDAIGYFQFRLVPDQKQDYLAFSFQNLRNESIQYMIIPPDELRRRLKKNIIRYISDEYFEIRLWLMDGNLYDTTYLGVEGEWYYLSKGRGGRMIDSTHWNYTKFLKNWNLR